MEGPAPNFFFGAWPQGKGGGSPGGERSCLEPRRGGGVINNTTLWEEGSSYKPGGVWEKNTGA